MIVPLAPIQAWTWRPLSGNPSMVNPTHEMRITEIGRRSREFGRQTMQHNQPVKVDLGRLVPHLQVLSQ